MYLRNKRAKKNRRKIVRNKIQIECKLTSSQRITYQF